MRLDATWTISENGESKMDLRMSSLLTSTKS